MKENSIEKDIKVLENLLNEGFEAMCYEEAQAIEHILSDYKKIQEEFREVNHECDRLEKIDFEKDKRIIELQKENEELKADRDKFKKALAKRITYCNELEKDLFENCSNYVVPRQKIKDKIEELKSNPLKIKQNDKYYFETHAYNKIIISVLQELIEESEK